LPGDYVMRSDNGGKLTPYAGVMYQLSRDYSLYASYADIYLSNIGERRIGGEFLAPADGVAIEGGI